MRSAFGRAGRQLAQHSMRPVIEILPLTLVWCLIGREFACVKLRCSSNLNVQLPLSVYTAMLCYTSASSSVKSAALQLGVTLQLEVKRVSASFNVDIAMLSHVCPFQRGVTLYLQARCVTAFSNRSIAMLCHMSAFPSVKSRCSPKSRYSSKSIVQLPPSTYSLRCYSIGLQL